MPKAIKTTGQRVIKATELHTRTRDVIEWARIDGQTVVVEYFGRPAVVILGYDAYQDYLAYRQQRQAAEEATSPSSAGASAVERPPAEDEAVPVAGPSSS